MVEQRVPRRSPKSSSVGGTWRIAEVNAPELCTSGSRSEARSFQEYYTSDDALNQDSYLYQMSATAEGSSRTRGPNHHR